jgi:hypothetical protein
MPSKKKAPSAKEARSTKTPRKTSKTKAPKTSKDKEGAPRRAEAARKSPEFPVTVPRHVLRFALKDKDLGIPALDDLPDDLKPHWYLTAITPRPTEWITVVSSRHEKRWNGGTSAYLASLPPQQHVRAGTWDLGSLGKALVWRAGEACRFQAGLVDNDREFIASVYTHHGLIPPRLDIALPFLWFHDAIPVENNNWIYLSEAGEEMPLIRATFFDDHGWSIEFAALPLRRFLAAAQRCLVIKHDVVLLGQTKLDDSTFLAVANDWAAFEVDIRHEALTSEYKSFVRLLGTSVVEPVNNDPCAEADWPRDEGPFPEFIYDVDAETGEPKTWTCEDERLSNYFVDRDAPHYLTPIYFRKEVLARYAQQPTKYRVTKGGLSCLDLWSLRMDINADGLVEVYLGDLGSYLPAAEREYWRTFNVPPSGGMNVDRYQRDFLAQWVFSQDAARELLDARHGADRAFRDRFGSPLYRALAREDETSFSGIHQMTTQDASEFDRLLVVLAKGVVDALDKDSLKAATGETDGTSLELLEQLVTQMNGDGKSILQALRDTQALRSSGGAHTRGSNYAKAIAKLGFSRLPLPSRFDRLLTGCVSSLRSIEALLRSSDESQKTTA